MAGPGKESAQWWMILRQPLATAWNSARTVARWVNRASVVQPQTRLRVLEFAGYEEHDAAIRKSPRLRACRPALRNEIRTMPKALRAVRCLRESARHKTGRMTLSSAVSYLLLRRSSPA